MKAFLLLLCAIALQANAQLRLASGGELAVAGDSPSIVHIRTTLFNTGYLRSCAGSLFDERWIITSANCATNARFMWIRYGALRVLSPDLVTELSVGAANTFIHPQYNAATGANNIALLFTNRVVHRTSYIDYASISTAVSSATGRFCGFGALSRVAGAIIELSPGDELRCINVNLEQQGEVIVATSTEGLATQYDDGAPLISNTGEQLGVLVTWPAAAGNIVGVFLRPALYLDWISSATGLELNSGNQISVVD